MPKIFLVRHGDYDNPRNILPGRLPVELSALGRHQAERLHEFFAQQNITHIYSSAVLRCRQTAEIISGGQIPISFDERILETLSAYQGWWGPNKHPGGYHFMSHTDELGGERLTNLMARMSDFWDETSPTFTGNTIICSHGDPLQVLYAHIHGLPLVDEGADEADIPGWINKGEYLEIDVPA